LLLFAWAYLSYEQIAATLAGPVGTVASRLSRARARLRKELGPLEGAGPHRGRKTEGRNDAHG
ncbi:MAG: sigma factor-like helix-turn-helix DNA-binding protein, partial [Actinomycetota bacterium]